MTRRELMGLYGQLDKAYRNFDRANNNVQLRHGYAGQIAIAERSLVRIEAEVERAEDDLGEKHCFDCKKWVPLGHDCLN